MHKVIACVNESSSVLNVCDYAGWAARRLAAPLEFLHVLDRNPEKALVVDLSGNIGLGSLEALLGELSALDERRSTLSQRQGRELLNGMVRRARDTGLAAVNGRQRHGSLVETLLDLEPEARLFVLGQHRPAEQGINLYLDHQVEQATRSVQRPILVATAGYREPKRFVIAFDGSPTGRRIVETVASSPLLKGLRCDVVMAGVATAEVQSQLAWALTSLLAAGFDPQAAVEAGEPETALPNYLRGCSADLLVMGAYGHSRIRQLIVGSTTTTLLRTSPVPVIVLR